MIAATLIKDYRNFIPAPPSIITEETWQERNRLVEKHYPHIADLMGFNEDHIIDILIDVESDKKPAAHFPVGPIGSPRPMAWLPKRSWLEWHLFRGVAPVAKRPTVSPSLRAAVIARDGLVCQLCNGGVEPDDVHLDHIKPFSLGGPTTFANLQVAHSLCNIRKGARV